MTGQVSVADTIGWDQMLETIAEETLITATRNDRSLSSVTVPALVIQGEAIRKQGMIKLSDVLQEQTGLQVTAANGSTAVGGGIFGNGIQVQGLSPEYTLIMVDGEPIIGRQGGVLDLTRFAVGNIRKIEIVKGPSSSLYGSEALGGVVNILTDQSRKDQVRLSARYGSFRSADLFALGQKEYKNASITGFLHFYTTDGYDLTPQTLSKTIDPHRDYTGQFRWTYRLSDRTRLIWSNRFFKGIQFSDFRINNELTHIKGDGIAEDWSTNPVIEHRWNNKVKSGLRLYATGYRYVQTLSESDGNPYYQDDFRQQFYRVEQQNEWNIHQKSDLTFGGGFIRQSVETQRYANRKIQHIAYGFLQWEYRPDNKWIIIPGLRYDANQDYASRLSPKVSFLYKANALHSFNGSYGSGFKAPDFRQLYLSYANPAAQGYRLFGAEEFSVAKMEAELSEGLLNVILPEAYQIQTLSPEYSHGFNVGYKGRIKNKQINWDVNLFYNDIQNLINYVPVAVQKNGSFVYSYRNTARAFTSGIESNISYRVNKYISWSAGYQFLYSGDQDVLRAVSRGEVFGRTSVSGDVIRMKISDYSGLLGRSPHMANFKINFETDKPNISGGIRLLYRSRWGVVDLDGNGFANMPEEYAKGFFTLNMHVQKTLGKYITVQVHGNNLLNYKDEVRLPHMPGTNVALQIMCHF